MARDQTCDFCGKPFEWTPEQEQLDIELRLFGPGFCKGLGAMCNTCDDKIIEIELRSMAEADEKERCEEGDELWESGDA